MLTTYYIMKSFNTSGKIRWNSGVKVGLSWRHLKINAREPILKYLFRVIKTNMFEYFRGNTTGKFKLQHESYRRVIVELSRS